MYILMYIVLVDSRETVVRKFMLIQKVITPKRVKEFSLKMGFKKKNKQ